MILYQYPKTFSLRDGIRIALRPLRKSDETLVHEFFSAIPPCDRMGLSEDFSDAGVVQNWFIDLDYQRVLPLAAFDNGRIAGCATLGYGATGWLKHQGRIDVTCDPEYRKKGVAKLLVKHLMKIARHTGLEQLSAEVAMSLEDVRFLLESLGFLQVSVLRGFVKYENGAYDDLVLMAKPVTPALMQQASGMEEQPNGTLRKIFPGDFLPPEKKQRAAL